MLEFYIARHGQTVWNEEGRLQGWLNSDLTAKGIKSAKRLGASVRDIQFDALYSSPSRRALETLMIARKVEEKDIIKDARLLEINLGKWQGLLLEEIKMKFPVENKIYFNSPEKFKMEGAESYFDVYDRVLLFINDIIKTYESMGTTKRILIITHGITLMMMRLIFHDVAIEEVRDYHVEGNAKLFIYKYHDEKFSLVKHFVEEDHIE